MLFCTYIHFLLPDHNLSSFLRCYACNNCTMSMLDNNNNWWRFCNLFSNDCLCGLYRSRNPRTWWENFVVNHGKSIKFAGAATATGGCGVVDGGGGGAGSAVGDVNKSRYLSLSLALFLSRSVCVCLCG